VSPTRAARARRYPVAAAVALATGLLGLAGCGGSSKTSSATTPASPAPATTATTSSTPAAGGAQTLKVAADPGGQLKFDKPSLTAKSGTITIDFTNASPVEHNLTVEGSSGTTQAATPTFQGGTKSVSLSLKPGTYTFYCSVPGHRQAGMEGKLTVQ
jgi:plastocyanin